MNRDPLTERVRATPDRPAVIDAVTGADQSYRELDTSVSWTAARLPAIEPGDRVGLLLSTSIDTVRTIHAVWRLGGTIVPLDPDQPEPRLQEQLQMAGASVILGPATDEPPLSEAIAIPIPLAEGDLDPTASVEDATWAWTDPMVVLFTSGTSGEPKPVSLTRRNLFASAAASAFRLGVTPTDNWICCLPVNHMGGLAPLIRSTVYGTTVTVHEGFDVEAIGDTICRHRPSGISLVPTQLKRLLDAGVGLSPLRFVLLGGGPAAPSLIDRCEAADVPVYPTYGLTETASQVTTATPDEAFSYRGTVGRPLIGTAVTIVDESDEPVPEGEQGEIVVAGPTVTPGYADDTDRGIGEFGLFTGDIGYLEDGRLWVTGRLSDVIISGGEQIHPTEVEAAIRSHPAVEAAAVVGIDDPEWGGRVGALVVADGPSADDLSDYLRDRLAPFKIPKTWAFSDSLPRTASGTVDRTAVVRRLRGVNTADDQ